MTTSAQKCHAKATCSSTGGSFTCQCNPGFIGDGRRCTDVNECTAGTHNCHSQATCSNTVGSFTCACNSEYVGDGVSCKCKSGYSDTSGLKIEQKHSDNFRHSFSFILFIRLFIACEAEWTKLKFGDDYSCFKMIPPRTPFDSADKDAERCVAHDAELPLPRR